MRDGVDGVRRAVVRQAGRQEGAAGGESNGNLGNPQTATARLRFDRIDANAISNGCLVGTIARFHRRLLGSRRRTVDADRLHVPNYHKFR